MDAKHVIISGGSRGLGLRVTRDLLSTGYQVTTLSRSTTDQLNELSIEFKGRLRIININLADTNEIDFVLHDIFSQSKIYGLINNAAIAFDGLLVTLGNKYIEDMIHVNLLAPIILSKLVARQMIRQHEGRIINISSIAANRAYNGLSTYSATKAGIEGFTRVLAHELGPRNITVNVISPGFMLTNMSVNLSDDQINVIKRRTPLNRLVIPNDVSSAIQFLLSPAANMITGQIISIDGGAQL